MRRTQDLDALDHQILAALEVDARRSTAEIAREVKLTHPATAERIARLRDIGVIEGFTVKLNPSRIGLHVGAFVEFEPHSNADAAGIAAVVGHPSVRSCYKVTGGALVILLVLARDGGDLHNVLLDFSKHGSTRTSVILSSELEQMPLFAERREDVIDALLKRSDVTPKARHAKPARRSAA